MECLQLVVEILIKNIFEYEIWLSSFRGFKSFISILIESYGTSPKWIMEV